MKLLYMYNAVYDDVCVLCNPKTFCFHVFCLDSGVVMHLTVVRGIQLTHRRQYAYPEPPYPVGLNMY